jgi:phosphoribosylamine--glycine ligase
MRFLGIGETNDLGDMYLRLAERGHEVRVHMSDAESKGVMDGMLDFTRSWRNELKWIRSAGDEGIILFETVSHGRVQDELREKGYNVIGGSGLGDRLEGDRSYAQKVLKRLGIRNAPSHQFANFESAVKFIRKTPRRYVLKLNGSGWPSNSTYIGQMDTGEDMLAMLSFTEDHWPNRQQVSFVLMDRVIGIETGVGAFFNGHEFMEPVNLDWEHKRFFPGEVGELTGEMGTIVTYRGAERIFEATLGRMERLLRSSGYCGYINLNTIVNEEGIWPLEFTCRFGYPGFPILDALHMDGWDDLFTRMIARDSTTFRTFDGYSAGVVMTVPPFPYSEGYEELGKGMAISFREDISVEDRDSLHYGEVALRDGQLVTAGMVGYVVVVTGRGTTIKTARKSVYDIVEKVVIPNARYRVDIGERLLQGDLDALKRSGWIST